MCVWGGGSWYRDNSNNSVEIRLICLYDCRSTTRSYVSCAVVVYLSNWKDQMGRAKRIWYLSPMRAAKVQASLRIRAVSPEPSLLAHTSSESRGTFRQKARSLAHLNSWACAVEICHDGMLEDTNSLGAAQISFSDAFVLSSLQIKGIVSVAACNIQQNDMHSAKPHCTCALLLLIMI